MFVCFCSLKTYALGFIELLETFFCLLLIVKAFSLQKGVKKWGWWGVRWIWQMRQNFIAQLVQLLKCWLCYLPLGVFHGELGPFCWPAANVAVFCASDGFAECTSQMWWSCQDSENYSGLDGQQTTKQWPWPFFGPGLALGSALELLVAPLVTQKVKNLPAMQETWVWSLGWEDPLEKGMETHSSILAWRIPWTEEPGGLQSRGLQRVGHDWVTNTSLSLLELFPVQPLSWSSLVVV